MHLLVQMQGQKVTKEDFGPRLENNLKIPNSFTNPRLHFVLKAISYLTWTPPSEVHHPVHLHGLEHGSRCQGELSQHQAVGQHCRSLTCHPYLPSNGVIQATCRFILAKLYNSSLKFISPALEKQTLFSMFLPNES